MNPTAPGVYCPRCGGAGEVPTADTAHLASHTVGGFEHPNLQFTACEACSGTGYVITTATGGAA